MKRRLGLWWLAVFVLLGTAGAGAQDGGNQLLVMAMEVDYYLPESDPELGLEKIPGDACIFMTDEWRPSMVIVENEMHEVIVVWPMVGVIVDAEQGPICSIAGSTTIDLPDAAFYLVFRDDDLIGAYSPDTLPANEEWALPLVVNLGYGD